MKHKRVYAILLCILIFAGAYTAVLAAGGAEDPLISASWLYHTLLPNLSQMLKKEPSGLPEVKDAYAARLDGVAFARGGDFDYAGKPTVLSLSEDDTLTLDEFGRFLLTEGTAKLRCHGCEVVDLTDGSVCADGSWLTARHRYFAADGSGAKIYVYADTQGLADGYYRLESDTVFPSADRYTDAEDHWAGSEIEWMTKLDAVNGVEKHFFAPDMQVTRAMFITALCRLLGTESDPGSHFEDVKNSDWYAPYVSWAAENGLVFGYDNGRFGPDDPITREQMAAILIRCCEKFGAKLTVNGRGGSFSDEDGISEWARPAVHTASQIGLMKGRDTGEFDPMGSATRAEMCVVCYRLYEKIA